MRSAIIIENVDKVVIHPLSQVEEIIIRDKQRTIMVVGLDGACRNYEFKTNEVFMVNKNSIYKAYGY